MKPDAQPIGIALSIEAQVKRVDRVAASVVPALETRKWSLYETRVSTRHDVNRDYRPHQARENTPWGESLGDDVVAGGKLTR
ncbi:hypothetical protein M3G43_16235 [Brevibacterium casei]|uniref:hypothetical protein n=1 Tax=Brevibacterium casei TaxID=33889 RepID=UPI00223B4DC5|nr:hypothetical protein [Brevibacterium casei]MCT1448803.1 hypothetical protein [Brevibacterium casei]